MRKPEHSAVETLRKEHRAIATTLRAAGSVLAQPGRLNDEAFTSLRAMLLFIDDFCGQEHHVKESEHLFAKVRARAPRARRLLDELDRQHVIGERRIREVEHALTVFELLGEDRREAFADALSRYTCFYLGHMEDEEKHLLPIAEQVLSEDDWDELEQADMAARSRTAQRRLTFSALFKRFWGVWPIEARQVMPWAQDD